jgi:glyoxylase-like metal-dependent hydrolase (beta-lactamase superfamily II)
MNVIARAPPEWAFKQHLRDASLLAGTCRALRSLRRTDLQPSHGGLIPSDRARARAARPRAEVVRAGRWVVFTTLTSGVIAAWVVGWTVIGAWRTATRDAWERLAPLR